MNDGVDPKVGHLIRSLANDVHLRLCSDSRLTKRFHALIRTAFPLKAQEPHGTSYLLHYDEGRMAVLVLSDKGLPSCYMTNGMIIAFDPARRGQLLLREHGHPSLWVGLDESAERAICTVEFETRATGAFALIDVSSILSGLLAKATHARLEDAGHLIEITTPRSSASVRLVKDDDSEAAVLRPVAVTAGRQSVAVGPVGLHSRTPARVLGITLDQIKNTGIPIKIVNTDTACANRDDGAGGVWKRRHGERGCESVDRNFAFAVPS
jgi:hypothetical protein